MTAARPPVATSSWAHFWRRTLPAYWIFVFCCTHFPNLQLDLGVPSTDKLLHCVAFGGLAFLFWQFAQTFRRPLSARFVWIAGFWLAAYAAFDEYTQRYVGRGVEIRDWLIGVVGIAVVLAALEWHRRWQVRRRGA